MQQLKAVDDAGRALSVQGGAGPLSGQLAQIIVAFERQSLCAVKVTSCVPSTAIIFRVL